MRKAILIIAVLSSVFALGFSVGKIEIPSVITNENTISLMESALIRVSDWEISNNTLYIYDVFGNYYEVR